MFGERTLRTRPPVPAGRPVRGAPRLLLVSAAVLILCLIVWMVEIRRIDRRTLTTLREQTQLERTATGSMLPPQERGEVASRQYTPVVELDPVQAGDRAADSQVIALREPGAMFVLVLHVPFTVRGAADVIEIANQKGEQFWHTRINSDVPSIRLTLDSRRLPPGDYEVSLSKDRKKHAVYRVVIRLDDQR